ncbi:MAG: metallophosphoesterase [Gammaproteobacteria bacterium]|nr:metallophosphoesterase [Gammaproteobacteria bacterium]
MAAAKSSRLAKPAARGRGARRGYTLAHFSDPHLSSPAHARMRELLNKRFFGYLSWISRRRAEHRREVLDALLRDLARLRPDHTVVTGDLTHLGLPSEFEQARRWLQTVGEPQDVTVVPGNHEAYVHASPEETLRRWQPYLSSDEASRAAALPAGGQAPFPSLRVRGPLALIGLSSARPSGFFLATGRVGQAQRDALSRVLEATGRRKLVRVLLIHHPPLEGTVGWRKRLVDSRSLRAILSRHGVELVLHGHGHRAAQGALRTATGTAPVLGVPSASTVSAMAGRRAQYYLYRFTDEGDARLLTVSVRGYAHARNGFAAEGERTLILPAAD